MKTIVVGVGLSALLLALMICGSSSAHAKSDDPAARTFTTSFKVPFPGPGGLESWLITLEMQRPDPDSELTSLRATLLREGSVAKQITYSSDAIGGLIPQGYETKADFYIDLLFHEPISLRTDQVSIEYTFTGGRSTQNGTKVVEVRSYEQANSYIFPLSGKAILTAGYFNSGGHLAPATLFAVDAVGLTESFAPVLDSVEESNASMAGWGREIVAPSSGEVVFVESGIPDQPYGTYDRESFARADGTYAHWGNAVVIDHGENEFGVIMHMQEGSVAVALGDKVEQGQPIGLLGNSGDSYGPHLHFHVQNEPLPGRGQGLPVSFSDLSVQFLRKGEWIDR